MKLYEIKKQSWVKIISDNKNPIASIPTKDGDEVFFDHLDGMYSFCRNKDGHVVHLAAWTDVELVEKD